MTTLYLSPRYTEDSQLLWKAAIKLGWDVQRLSWSSPNSLDSSEVKNRIIYGETIFTSVAAEKLKLKLYEPPSTFLMDLQRRYEMNLYLEKEMGVSPFEIHQPTDFLLRKVYNYYHFNPSDDKIYIPPQCVHPVKPLFNPDDPPEDFLNSTKFVKPVEKGLFTPGIFTDPIAQIQTLSHNTEVVVSEIVDWDIEFRAFVSGGKVKTISPYSRKGEITTQASAQEWEQGEAFANKIAQLYSEPFVIDVGYLTNDNPWTRSKKSGWAVVEANGACSSGIYGCDPIEALKVIKEACND